MFHVATDESIRLTIYNLMGREVRILVDESLEPGRYRVRWDGKDVRGEDVPSGIYFGVLRGGTSVRTRKITILR
jgi:flagellar hook assembly protein FlgD